MSKNRPLSQHKVLHVVIAHASHRYILCWYMQCLYTLCVLCAVYFAAVSHVRFVTICRAAICFVSIYCVLRRYMPCCYIYCAALKHVIASERKSGRNFTHVRSLCRIRTHTKHNRIHNEPPHKPALPSSLLTKADLACIESTPCFQL